MRLPGLVLLAVLLVACTALAPVPTPTPLVTPRLGADPCRQGTAVLCALNPDVTQDTIAATVCKAGWTATVRPPTSYTNRLKLEQMQRSDLAGPPSAWEEDHRMPLELGGAPRDPINLSPEQPPSPNPKDRDEDALHRLVCAHKIGLASAQVQLTSKWLDPYPGYKTPS